MTNVVMTTNGGNAQGAALAKSLGCADARERDRPIAVIYLIIYQRAAACENQSFELTQSQPG